MSDLLETARSIADTVLYEGYLLYPYRSSSGKNQVRWQYGIVGPTGAAAAGAGEESSLQTECLLDAGAGTRVDVYLRFLQVQARTVEAAAADGGYNRVEQLPAGATTCVPWEEAVEQEIAVLDVSVSDLADGRTVDVDVAAGEEVEPVSDAGRLVGRVVRRRLPLRGRLQLSATAAPGDRPLWILCARLDNTGETFGRAEIDARAGSSDGYVHRAARARDAATRQSFVGTHFLMTVRDGAFVSLIDPPAPAAAAAAACTNRRAWPVLVGQSGQTDVVLASPIILYDYPELAPESPGALYDSTEIDEILTLRIMTLTDEEKAAARATDPRAAEIIDRSDQMPPEVFEKLHGALRSFGAELPPAAQTADQRSAVHQPSGEQPVDLDGIPWWGEGMDDGVAPERDAVRIGAVEVSKGSRVRLRPSRRADAQDLFLADRTAVVTRVYSDVDGGTHVAVMLEDDELAEINDWYGRYYYFAPDELEPLQARREAVQ